MCGQTFSKAVNLPFRQNTPTSVPSSSTTLRPGSGNAAALPITTSFMGHISGCHLARRYHIDRSNRLRSTARIISVTKRTISVGVILSADPGGDGTASDSALAAYNLIAAVSTRSSWSLAMREAAAHDRARSATSTNAAAMLPNSSPGLAAAGVNLALFGILRLPRSSSAYVSSPRPHPLYFQVEHASRLQTEDVALALLAQEWDRGEGARRVEVPIRPG